MATKKTTKTTKKASTKKPKQLVADPQRNILRTWNLRLAALLVIEAIAIVILGGNQTVPLTTQYLTTDVLASEAAGHQVLAVATRHLWDVQLSWLVAKFLLIFALVYLAAATVWRSRYERWLESGVNKLRWVGLGFGGGVMAVVVAMLAGISDVSTLVLIFGTVAGGATAAAALELLGPERRLKRLLAALAISSVVLLWIVLLRTAGGSALFGGSMPTFVYYVYLSMLLFSVAAGLATHWRTLKKGKWADTVYAERMFMFLGFAAASVLAWQVYAGALTT